MGVGAAIGRADTACGMATLRLRGGRQSAPLRRLGQGLAGAFYDPEAVVLAAGAAQHRRPKQLRVLRLLCPHRRVPGRVGTRRGSWFDHRRHHQTGQAGGGPGPLRGAPMDGMVSAHHPGFGSSCLRGGGPPRSCPERFKKGSETELALIIMAARQGTRVSRRLSRRHRIRRLELVAGRPSRTRQLRPCTGVQSPPALSESPRF